MGTNFYAMDDTHVGKRSASGLWCYNCGVTLCEGGIGKVHSSDSKWHSECPKCGKKYLDGIDLDAGSAAVELGFADPYKKKERKGVKTCSSFSWAIKPGKIKKFKRIKDEYGKEYTLKKFEKIVLDNCPMQFTDSIGLDFS